MDKKLFYMIRDEEYFPKFYEDKELKKEIKKCIVKEEALKDTNNVKIYEKLDKKWKLLNLNGLFRELKYKKRGTTNYLLTESGYYCSCMSRQNVGLKKVETYSGGICKLCDNYAFYYNVSKSNSIEKDFIELEYNIME